MRYVIRKGIVPTLIALGSVLAAAIPASADLSTVAPYEIEAKLQYCVNGGTACVPATGRPDLANLRFALVEAFRITPPPPPFNAPGSMDVIAPPEAVIAKCAGAHWIDKRGNIHAKSMYVYAGPTSQGFDGGTVRGTAYVLDGTEASTQAIGSIDVEAYDPITHDRASVRGLQITSNDSDTRVSGGFTVTLSGPQFDELVTGPDFNPAAQPRRDGNGSMTCNTLGTPVSVHGAPPPYFENEVYDTFDGNS